MKRKKLSPELIASKIIIELKSIGLTPEQMLKVIKLAKKKFNHLKNNQTPLEKQNKPT